MSYTVILQSNAKRNSGSSITYQRGRILPLHRPPRQLTSTWGTTSASFSISPLTLATKRMNRTLTMIRNTERPPPVPGGRFLISNPKVNRLFCEYVASKKVYSQESLCYLSVSCLAYQCFSRFFLVQVLYS